MSKVSEYNNMVRAAAAAGTPYTSVPDAIAAFNQLQSGGSAWAPQTKTNGEYDYAMQQEVTATPMVAGAAGIPEILTGAAGALGLELPAGLAGILGLAGAGYGLWQALGGGEGGGLFDNNLLGGDDFTLGGVEFGGPGLSEPMVPYTEWHVGDKQFYYVKQYNANTGKFTGAKVFMYNKSTKQWKWWRLPKPHLAVIGKNQPSHRMLTRLRHNVRRHVADAKTILQLGSPAYYAKTHGYYRRKRR